MKSVDGQKIIIMLAVGRKNFFSKLIFSKLITGTMERTREFPKLSKSLSSFCLVKIIERERERHGLSLMDVKNKAS